MNIHEFVNTQAVFGLLSVIVVVVVVKYLLNEFSKLLFSITELTNKISDTLKTLEENIKNNKESYSSLISINHDVSSNMRYLINLIKDLSIQLTALIYFMARSHGMNLKELEEFKEVIAPYAGKGKDKR